MSRPIGELEVELPVAVPADWVEPRPTPEEVLAAAGFEPEQYRLLKDVCFWMEQTSWGWSGESPDGMRRDWEDPAYAAYLAQKGEDGVWEIGSAAHKGGGLDLLAAQTVRPTSRWSPPQDAPRLRARAALEEMGVSPAKVGEIKACFEKQAAEAHRAHTREVQEWACGLTQRPAFACLPEKMREQMRRLVAGDQWECDRISIRGSLPAEWPKAEELLARQAAGEIIVDFSAWHRRGGATNQGDGWVVRPDGSLREPDQRDVPRHKDDGMYRWRVLGPEELALRWAKDCSAASHIFEVVKLPVGGCTPAQMATVGEIEKNLDDEWRGRCGLASGIPSPPVGEGWGLCKKPEPPKPGPEEPEEPAAPPATLDDLRRKFNGR